MALTPIALPQALPSELLTYILTQQAYPTTLIICQPRAVFLSSLLEAVSHTPRPRSHTPDEPTSSPTAEDPVNTSNQPLERHPLLIPTLHQVATSQHVELAFIPTVSHLRAYLAVFPPSPIRTGPPGPSLDGTGKRRVSPSLIVYGLVGLHRDTSEWSAQGLGNSLSGLVDAGQRAGRRLVLLEERMVEDAALDVDMHMDMGEGVESRKKAASGIWDERVPMLNGSARRAGLESEDGGWSGRTVEVGRILGRWFKFWKGELGQ